MIFCLQDRLGTNTGKALERRENTVRFEQGEHATVQLEYRAGALKLALPSGEKALAKGTWGVVVEGATANFTV